MMTDDSRIVRLEADVEHLKSDVAEIKIDLKGLRTELTAFRGEFADFRVEVAKRFGSLKVWMLTTGVGMIVSILTSAAALLRALKP